MASSDYKLFGNQICFASSLAIMVVSSNLHFPPAVRMVLGQRSHHYMELQLQQEPFALQHWNHTQSNLTIF